MNVKLLTEQHLEYHIVRNDVTWLICVVHTCFSKNTNIPDNLYVMCFLSVSNYSADNRDMMLSAVCSLYVTLKRLCCKQG